jgi:hypothetical protein|tara:strand:+ start:162 stop:353 length:192 start_codon:yes stop_codon:yes gene_type:complete
MSKKKNETKIKKEKRVSGAGKGDKLRRGISVDEWGKKWEAIFRKKESAVVVDKGSTDESEGTT